MSATDIQFWFSKTIRGVAANFFLLSPNCRSLERAGVRGGGEDIKKSGYYIIFKGITLINSLEMLIPKRLELFEVEF